MQIISTAILFSLLDLSVNGNRHFVDVQIPCKANTEQGLHYRKITWYKVEEGSDVLTGLVMKDLHTHITVPYKNAKKSYRVGGDYALLLPEAELKDCGRYRCTLWPPVGHYIQDGDYEYYPPGCTERPQQSETFPVEKIWLSLSNILSLIILGVSTTASVMVLCYCYTRIKCDTNTKQDL